jgi:hypothetical protein
MSSSTGFTIKKATRAAVKIKIFLSGPSGSGKTDGALALARNFAGPTARICVIDTERESASYYADRYEFDTLALDAPYHTDRYIEALRLAVEAGYDVVIIDSLTHQWSGVGGILERKEQLDSRPNSNSFTNWAKFTPETERFRNALLEAPVHLIACCRAKQEYVLGDGGSGKRKVEKMGLKPEQRDGLEYEFGVALQLQMDHRAEATKDRTGVFEGKIANLKDAAVARALRAWLDAGGALRPEARPDARPEASSSAPAAAALGTTPAALEGEISRATMPEKGGICRDDSIESLLTRAYSTALMGRAESFDGYGGRALGQCPDKVLKGALRFFKEKVTARANPRMEEQVELISLILADREAHSEQAKLPLDRERTAPTPRLETIAPVPASAVQEAERVLAAHGIVADEASGTGAPAPSWATDETVFPTALVDKPDDLPF